jgi:lipopolysaccharide export LptBFGC system permease protein LptF
MTNPQIDWVRPDGSRVEIFAARGWCSNNVWIFTTNAHTTNIQMNVYASGTGELLLRTNPPSFTAYDFDETPEQIKSEIYIASLAHNTRNVEIPLLRILNYLSLHPKLPRSEANWLYTQLHGRIAEPFTCLVVVLIAIPFGVSGGRRNVFVGVASSIFIVFTYFVLMRLCIAFGSRGWLAPWLAAWLPNLSFAAIALWLMRRVR